MSDDSKNRVDPTFFYPIVHLCLSFVAYINSIVVRHIPTWFPGPLGDFKRLARDWRHDLYGLTERSYTFVKEQVVRVTSGIR